jgi:hypothetical protein
MDLPPLGANTAHPSRTGGQTPPELDRSILRETHETRIGKITDSHVKKPLGSALSHLVKW